MIVDGHGFESVLDGAIKFERKPSRTRDRSRDEMPKLMLVVQEIFRPRRSCRSSRSSKACAEPDQPIDRSNRSVATARNGRRAISVDGPRRILSGQSDMTGCAPASRCTMGTSYRLTGCEGPKRRQHAVLRAAPAAIFGWLVLVRSAKPCFSGACPLVGFYLVAISVCCLNRSIDAAVSIMRK